MSKLIPEILLRSSLYKSQQEFQGFKRCWEKCELFRNQIEIKLHPSKQQKLIIGFYPTTQQIGFSVIGPNCDVIKACSLDSSYSINSDTRQFLNDLASKLREQLIPYVSSTDNIQLMFQRQPPILGINSEKIRNVLQYSEFVGVLQYECFQLCHSWPESILLSDIAKWMKLKLYELQERGERRLQTLYPGIEANSVVSTAVAISEFGYIYTLAKSILEEYGIVEHPQTNAIDQIKEKDVLVKMFIAGNVRALHDYDSLTIENVLLKDYDVGLLFHN